MTFQGVSLDVCIYQLHCHSW